MADGLDTACWNLSIDEFLQTEDCETVLQNWGDTDVVDLNTGPMTVRRLAELSKGD